MSAQEPTSARPRVLVTAASKHGSTAEIAEAIGRGLSERGLEVDVREPDVVSSLERYDAVVIGSAVYAGHWMEAAKVFVARHSDELRKRSIWLFSSGPIGEPARPVDDPVDVAGVTAATWPRQHRVFAGKLERHRLGFGERAIMTAVHAADGDYRDWAEIDAWAAHIASELGATVSA